MSIEVIAFIGVEILLACLMIAFTYMSFVLARYEWHQSTPVFSCVLIGISIGADLILAAGMVFIYSLL